MRRRRTLDDKKMVNGKSHVRVEKICRPLIY